MKNLETMGVQEMDAKEMRKAEGGCLALIMLCLGMFGLGYKIAELLDL